MEAPIPDMTDNLARVPSDKAVGDREFQAGKVLIVATGHMLHDSFSAFLSPLLPLFIKTLSLSNAEAGLLDVFLHLPSLLQPFIGYAADRVNLRYLFFLAPAVTAATMSCLTLTPSYGALTLLLLAAGVSVACFHSVGPALAGSLSGRRLGWTMSVWMVGGTLGMTLGPIAVVTALRLLGPQRLPWLMLGGLLGSVILYVALKGITVRSPGMHRGLHWRQALRRLGPVIAPVAAIVVAQSFVASGLRAYLPVFMSEEGADLWFAGTALSLYQGGGILGALLGGALSDRIGRRQVIALSLLATPLLMFLFLEVSGWARLLVLLALGPVVISTAPVRMALVLEAFPENRALAGGALMSVYFVINSLVVVAIGAIADLVGMRGAYTACALAPLLGLPLILLLPRKSCA